MSMLPSSAPRSVGHHSTSDSARLIPNSERGVDAARPRGAGWGRVPRSSLHPRRAAARTTRAASADRPSMRPTGMPRSRIAAGLTVWSRWVSAIASTPPRRSIQSRTSSGFQPALTIDHAIVGSSRSRISRAHGSASRPAGQAHCDQRRQVAAAPAAAPLLGGRAVADLQPRGDALAERLLCREHDPFGVEAELGAQFAGEEHGRRAGADDRDHDAVRVGDRGHGGQFGERLGERAAQLSRRYAAGDEPGREAEAGEHVLRPFEDGFGARHPAERRLLRGVDGGARARWVVIVRVVVVVDGGRVARDPGRGRGAARAVGPLLEALAHLGRRCRCRRRAGRAVAVAPAFRSRAVRGSTRTARRRESGRRRRHAAGRRRPAPRSRLRRFRRSRRR